MAWVAAVWACLGLIAPRVQAQGPARPLVIQLARTPLARELEPMLLQELRNATIVRAPARADLYADLLGTPEYLRLRLFTPQGRTLVERRFSLSRGRAGALRAVVLALERAVAVERSAARPAERPPGPPPPLNPVRTATTASLESSSAAGPAPGPIAGPPVGSVAVERTETPTTTPAEAPGRSVRWWGGAGGASAWVGRAPQLGFIVSTEVRLRAFGLGARFSMTGFCCATSVDSGTEVAIDGRATSLAALLDLQWRALRIGWFEGGLWGSGGVERLSLSVVPQIFEGAPPTTELVSWSGLFQLGGSLSASLIKDALALRLELGLQVRTEAPSVRLPEGFPVSAAPLSVGRFGPVFSLRLETKFF